MKMKIEVKKVLMVDGIPFVHAEAAAKSLARTVAARYASKIRLAELEKGSYDASWRTMDAPIEERHLLFTVYGVGLPTRALAEQVRDRRKRAYRKFKSKLERYLLD